jgi:hypothetical protein
MTEITQETYNLALTMEEAEFLYDVLAYADAMKAFGDEGAALAEERLSPAFGPTPNQTEREVKNNDQT